MVIKAIASRCIFRHAKNIIDILRQRRKKGALFKAGVLSSAVDVLIGARNYVMKMRHCCIF